MKMPTESPFNHTDSHQSFRQAERRAPLTPAFTHTPHAEEPLAHPLKEAYSKSARPAGIESSTISLSQKQFQSHQDSQILKVAMNNTTSA
jgi:hypothetical protein